MDRTEEFLQKIKKHKDIMKMQFTPKLDDEIVRHGLGLAHFTVMCNLRDKGTNPLITELARQLTITYPTMTNIVDRLEKMGLARRSRDARDRRAIRLVLTGKGTELLDRIDREWEVKIRQFIGGIQPEDRKALLEALSTLFEITMKYSGKKA